MKVLLIEDDHGFRTTLARALERRDCQVTQAEDAENALTAAGQQAFDGIVLDVRLGHEDGTAMIPQLRHLQPTARMVILTGFGSIPGALEALRKGADDYLLKPANASQVLLALQGRSDDSPRPDAPEVPSLARLEWEHIQRVLHDCGGNISRTAEVLGIDRRTLQRKLAKLPPQT